MSPSDDGSIGKNRGKGLAGSLDLLYISQLLLHSTAITTTLGIAPGHDRSIAKNGCKSGRIAGCLDFVYVKGQRITMLQPGILDTSVQNASGRI